MQLHLTASWAICEVAGARRHPECLEVLCRFSMAAHFPIATAGGQLEVLDQQAKWELTQLASQLMQSLGPSAELQCASELLKLVDTLDEYELFRVYRMLLDKLFNDAPMQTHDREEIKETQVQLIERIISDDRIWSYAAMAERWKERLRLAGLPDTRQGLQVYGK